MKAFMYAVTQYAREQFSQIQWRLHLEAREEIPLAVRHTVRRVLSVLVFRSD